MLLSIGYIMRTVTTIFVIIFYSFLEYVKGFTNNNLLMFKFLNRINSKCFHLDVKLTEDRHTVDQPVHSYIYIRPKYVFTGFSQNSLRLVKNPRIGTF